MSKNPIRHTSERSVLCAAGPVWVCALCAALRSRFILTLQKKLSTLTNRSMPQSLAALLLVAMTVGAWPVSQGVAAPRPASDRSSPGSEMNGSGTAAGHAAAQQAQSTLAPSRANARSLNGSGGSRRCAALQKRYAQSEACFARYRMKNRGLEPGAFQHCKQLKDPSVKCGSSVAR